MMPEWHQLDSSITMPQQQESKKKQVAQWATNAHLRASIMFGDTIIDDAERQVTLNLKQ